MTPDAREDAMIRFLLQDKDHPGDERCPECGSPNIQAERNHLHGEIVWALCDDCGYRLITDFHIPQRDLDRLPSEIRSYYDHTSSPRPRNP